ncbi:OmpA family protein [Tenacibaculum ovolyticum]|uniref:OmpA family protein n=1 Tax=Tenacibaculum ovolyticum TaxID=104270 RepID=UPI003BA8A74D
MKKTITILFTLFIVICSNAQEDRDFKRAKKYFDRAFYSHAIPLFEKAIKKDKNFKTIKNLADSYYFINDMNKAAINYKLLFKYYKKLVDEPYYFRYANTLKATGDYKEADNLLRSYYKKNDAKKLQKLEAEIEYLENIKAIGNRYTIKNLAINTPNSEFGAIQKGNSIIFSAAKKNDEGTSKTYGWTGNGYLDIYKMSLNNETEPFSTSINTKLHESNIIFTKNAKTAYFTRNNLVKGKRKKDNKKITHLQIYKAQLINGEWKNITSLPFNSDEYSSEHPALSDDEKTLYFSSDMPNGYGSFDIYAVAINNNGTYGNPKNLGATINTPKKEQFPFISKDNKLYFSSNGHPGFGSLDVFVSTISNNKYSQPDNVGLPINSGYDDFSFNINNKTKEGFFASNRPEGKGNDDIYKIVEEKALIIEDCKQSISGVITDIDTKEAIGNTLILIGTNNNDFKKIYTNANGAFSFRAICEASYIVIASKEGYQEKRKTILTNKERNKNNDASIALKSITEIEKEKRIALQLKAKKAQELKIAATNKLKLQNKTKIEQTIAKENSLEKDNGRIIIKTDEINFDYKLWYLRKDTKRAINYVIKLMKKYPKMIVEIGTHSDIRGNNRYNLELSQKRATSARMYFIENGIKPERVIAIGYGETQPLIKCKTEDACTEEQHETNRRCEFVVKQIY